MSVPETFKKLAKGQSTTTNSVYIRQFTDAYSRKDFVALRDVTQAYMAANRIQTILQQCRKQTQRRWNPTKSRYMFIGKWRQFYETVPPVYNFIFQKKRFSHEEDAIRYLLDSFAAYNISGLELLAPEYPLSPSDFGIDDDDVSESNVSEPIDGVSGPTDVSNGLLEWIETPAT